MRDYFIVIEAARVISNPPTMPPMALILPSPPSSLLAPYPDINTSSTIVTSLGTTTTAVSAISCLATSHVTTAQAAAPAVSSAVVPATPPHSAQRHWWPARLTVASVSPTAPISAATITLSSPLPGFSLCLAFLLVLRSETAQSIVGRKEWRKERKVKTAV